jgi:hypothetical protein
MQTFWVFIRNLDYGFAVLGTEIYFYIVGNNAGFKGIVHQNAQNINELIIL